MHCWPELCVRTNRNRNFVSFRQKRDEEDLDEEDLAIVQRIARNMFGVKVSPVVRLKRYKEN